jgi:hypothetical protein
MNITMMVITMIRLPCNFRLIYRFWNFLLDQIPDIGQGREKWIIHVSYKLLPNYEVNRLSTG